MAKTKTIHKKGKKPIKFKPGALHKQLGVSSDKRIPAAKMEEAREGELGPLAKKRAMFAKNVLTGGKKKKKKKGY